MDEQQKTQDPLAAAYEASVSLEREAWNALHAHAPGSRERIAAWKTWSEAISRTNDAWRQLSARRFSEFHRSRRHAEAGSHASA